MKIPLQAVAKFFLVFCSSIALGAGGSDGAGGDGDRLSPDAVKTIIETTLKKEAKRVLEGERALYLISEFDVFAMIPVQNRNAIHQILTRRYDPFASSHTFFKYVYDSSPEEIIDSIRFDIRVDGPCAGPTGHRDASTLKVKGAPICLSALLLSRYTAYDLKKVLVGLLFHELSHQYGQPEDIAAGIQRFFRSFLEVDTILISVLEVKFLGDSRLDHFKVDGTVITSALCMQAGRLTGLVTNSLLKQRVVRDDLLATLCPSGTPNYEGIFDFANLVLNETIRALVASLDDHPVNVEAAELVGSR